MAQRDIFVTKTVKETQWFCDNCHENMTETRSRSHHCRICSAFICKTCYETGYGQGGGYKCPCCTEHAKLLAGNIELKTKAHNEEMDRLKAELEAEQNKLDKQRKEVAVHGCSHCGKNDTDPSAALGPLHFCSVDHLLEYDRKRREPK